MAERLVIEAGGDEAELRGRISEACDGMERIFQRGCYPKITVRRHWSKHNPVISGEIARPSAYRWYLCRELLKLALQGAEIEIEPSRERASLDDPSLLKKIDESDLDITRKKLFLFGPERVELSIQRLEHYTGTGAEHFQRYVLLTNYKMYMDAFEEIYPGCSRPSRPDEAKRFYHETKKQHISVATAAVELLKHDFPDGLPNTDIRSPDEPLMGGSSLHGQA